jgi:hypothetical protein
MEIVTLGDLSLRAFVHENTYKIVLLVKPFYRIV